MPAPTIYDLLVGYYKFDALTSGQVIDSANQGAVGTLSNAGLVSGGKFGNALRTTTSAGKMTVDDFLVHRQSPTNRISVNVWINLDKALNTMWGTPKFLDKTGGGTSGYFLGVLAGGGNNISFRVHNSAGTPYTATYTESATSGWVMITGVYEGSVVRIYRNGVSQNTAVADGSLRFASSIIDNIGLGFEGLIDEMSIWTRMLSSGEVTTLYAAGAGLELIYPNQYSPTILPTLLTVTPKTYLGLDGDIVAVPSPLDVEGVSANPVHESFNDVMLSMIPTPYEIVDSPARIYVDPNPVITSLTIDGNHVAYGVAEAGPTDAYQTYNYWEIELEEGVSIVVVDQMVSTKFFEARAVQEDDWNVPEGSNWQNKRARFVVQAVQDSSQIWYSDWVDLTDPNWDNADCPYPDPAVYSDPVPQIVNISVDEDRNVTAIGIAGPTEAEDVMYRWEIELPGGEVIAVGGETIDSVFSTREEVTSTFQVPDGQLWDGMRIRFTVRNEDSAKRHIPQSWSSSWFTLDDPYYDNPATPTPPEPPVWPYAVNPAPDLPQISSISVDLYDVSRYTVQETSDLFPIAAAIDVTTTIACDTKEPQLLLENAKAGLYRIQYVSGARRDEDLFAYNEFFPGAWKTLSRGLWIQSGKHTPWYVFQSPAFTESGYNTEIEAEEAAQDYEFIFFHKGGDLSVVWDIDAANVGAYSGEIALRVRDVEAEYIPGKWSIVSYEKGSPVIDNTGVIYPTISGLGRGLTHIRYFLNSGDKKPRWQNMYIRVWPKVGTESSASSASPVQNPAAYPNDLTGSGASVKERRDILKKSPTDGNAGSSTQDNSGAE
jgi:hypothetical protein